MFMVQIYNCLVLTMTAGNGLSTKEEARCFSERDRGRSPAPVALHPAALPPWLFTPLPPGRGDSRFTNILDMPCSGCAILKDRYVSVPVRQEDICSQNGRLRLMNRSPGMNLKSRMAFSFLCTVLIPVVLCALAMYGLTNLNVRMLGRQYGIENPTYESVYNNSILVSLQMDESLERITAELSKDPERIQDPQWLNQMNDSLKSREIYMVVRKGSRLLFNGAPTLGDIQLLAMLPSYGRTDRTEPDDLGIIQVRRDAMLKQADFQFPDGEEGSLFLMSALSRVSPELKLWTWEMILIIILILAMTSLIVSMWIYQGVITPINELKHATQNIRDGNLDFTVKGCEVREINDLCQDFEEMRIRLKQSTEEKVAFDRESKELVSNISHDLKTPVTAIKGYVEGIIDGVADTPEKMERYVRTIYNKTIDIDRLIDELTMYSKIDTNRIPYNFTKIHATEYFDDCVDELRMELDGRGIGLSYFNYLREDAVIIADPEQLKRVINNIISNSIKYMDKKQGVINIRLRDVGDFIQAEFEDNGRGIAQKDLGRIFDRFYRTDASRNSRQGGSGIGLSIVRKILEDHEGKVWATSKEGVGTVIYFVLRKYREPEVLAEADQEGRPEAEEKAAASAAGKKWIGTRTAAAGRRDRRSRRKGQ